MIIETLFSRSFQWLRATALVVLLLVCLAGIVGLGLEVLRKLEALRGANEDNVEWTLSQVEVEYLHFKLAANMAATEPDVSMDFLRQRFDVFYSRIDTIERSNLYSYLTQNAGVAAYIDAIKNFLKKTVLLIDSEDDVLRASLPDIVDELSSLQMPVRLLSLAGLKNFAMQSDTQRESIATTLFRMALLTGFLVLLLLGVTGMLLYMYRVSSSRAIERRQIAKRLSTIISSSLDAVLVVDEQGIVVEFNGAAESIFGYSYDEIVGHSLSGFLIPERYVAAHEAGMRRFNTTNRHRLVGAGRVPMTARRKNGDEFPIELSLSSIIDGGENVFVAFIRDISAERQAEKELISARDLALASEKSKAEFFAVMSHEMRTPLNGLLGALSLLTSTELSRKQRAYLETMESSGQILLHHVNDVLEISKYEAGKTEIRKTQFDLAELIEHVAKTQYAAAEAKRNNFEINWLTEKVSAVISDPVRVQQVLLNLIGNANKFTEAGTIAIELEAFREQDDYVWVEVKVIDSGIGIDEKDLGRIFDDFETAGPTYGRLAEGTGLGLGIAKRMVNALGGEIGVESEEGVGSVFWFRLPLKKAKVKLEPLQLARPKISSGQGRKILIVEDNDINRFVLREMLSDPGYSLVEAENGKKGVELAQKTRFDLILMDISMPVMDGFQAVEAIRTGEGASKNAPIVATTAHAMQEEIARFKSSGMDDFVTKPIVREKLDQLVARYVNIKEEIKTQEITGKTLIQEIGTPLEDEDMDDDDFDLDLEFIDHERIAQMYMDLGAETLSKLKQRFYQEANETLLNFVKAPKNSIPTDKLISDLHRLAGSAATLGFDAVRKELNHIEMLGKKSQDDMIWKSRNHLLELLKESQEQYENLLALILANPQDNGDDRGKSIH